MRGGSGVLLRSLPIFIEALTGVGCLSKSMGVAFIPMKILLRSILLLLSPDMSRMLLP